MNRLNAARRAAVVSALVEGNSVRSTCRMMNVSIPTVLKLLADLGAACANFHDTHVRGLKSRRLQADETWQFCYSKMKNVPADKQGTFGYGDVWTWVVIDADSKLVVSYMVGPRTPPMAYEIMKDAAARVSGRVQISTDGLYWYVHAIDHAFGSDVDYGVIQKHYGRTTADASAATRYSPAKITSVSKELVLGEPDERHISTSYVERQNLTMRMSMRRFTRLTNGFSKKIENHAAAVALHYVFYNFARVHTTLRVTPAMQAGLADHVWSIGEIVALLEKVERPDLAA